MLLMRMDQIHATVRRTCASGRRFLVNRDRQGLEAFELSLPGPLRRTLSAGQNAASGWRDFLSPIVPLGHG